MGIVIEKAKEILDFAESQGVIVDSAENSNDQEIIAEAESLLDDAFSQKDQNNTAKSIWEKYGDLIPRDEPEIDIAAREKLPLPLFVHIDKLPEMPTDLTQCSDEEIRQLHSQFHAYQIRTNWLCGSQENKVKQARHEYKLAYDNEMLRIDPFLRNGDRAPKEKTKAYIEAEIMQNKKVVEKKESLLKLESDLSALQTLADIYESNVSRLSRESSMRYAERA